MSESVGQRLRQAREARSLSLEQVAQTTYMRARYLQALEEGRLDLLPSIAQARGFLRAYAGFLGLDIEVLLVELETSTIPAEVAAGVAPMKTQETAQIPSQDVQAIYKEIGKRLHDQRKMLGISFEDVELHTHLRRQTLRLIEAGELDKLPSPVQGRGILKNYAEFLGMDPDSLLLRYADALQTRFHAKQAAGAKVRFRTGVQSPPVVNPLRRLFSGEFLITGMILIFVGAFVLWGVGQILEARKNQEPSPTAPSIADVLLAASTGTLIPTAETPTPTRLNLPVATQLTSSAITPEAPQATNRPGFVQVYITARQRAWMRVSVDGKVEFEGRVLPSSAYQFSGEKQVEILTGNAAALQVFFNQKDQGLMGNYQEVIDRIYTVEGVLIPTATTTPTDTATPIPSPTPKPTNTQRP